MPSITPPVTVDRACTIAAMPNVTATATLIASNTAKGMHVDPDDDWQTKRLRLKNVTGSATVFLGKTDGVTTGAGFPWATADGPFEWSLEPGEQLWGIVASVTQVVAVLDGGR